jgi:hypothetical protein
MHNYIADLGLNLGSCATNLLTLASLDFRRNAYVYCHIISEREFGSAHTHACRIMTLCFVGPLPNSASITIRRGLLRDGQKPAAMFSHQGQTAVAAGSSIASCLAFGSDEKKFKPVRRSTSRMGFKFPRFVTRTGILWHDERQRLNVAIAALTDDDFEAVERDTDVSGFPNSEQMSKLR